LVLIFSDYSQPHVTINSIDMKKIDMIKDWLTYYYI
jgi:nucleosome binding factor SPN SPT16 subunit